MSANDLISAFRTVAQGVPRAKPGGVVIGIHGLDDPQGPADRDVGQLLHALRTRPSVVVTGTVQSPMGEVLGDFHAYLPGELSDPTEDQSSIYQDLFGHPWRTYDAGTLAQAHRLLGLGRVDSASPRLGVQAPEHPGPGVLASLGWYASDHLAGIPPGHWPYFTVTLGLWWSAELVASLRDHRPRILIVCHANQVRSPLIAALLQALAPHWHVASAGISDAQAGQPIDPRIREELLRRDLPADHRSQVLVPEDGTRYDAIWFVDRATRDHPRRAALRGPARIGLVFDDDLPDPRGATAAQIRLLADDYLVRLRTVLTRWNLLP